MKTLTLASLLLIIGGNLAVAQELPSDASEILKKLQQFEVDERTKAETAIREKRKAVAIFLEEILERETKGGNLETAVAIKSKIRELTANPEEKSEKMVPADGGELPKSKRRFEDWLATVELFEEKKSLVHRIRGGRIRAYKDGQIYGQAPEIKIEGTKVSWVWGGDGVTVHHLEVDSPTKGKITSERGTNELIIRPSTDN